MKQPMFDVTCEICGGTGLGTIKTAAAAWDSNQRVSHSDPDVCRMNLARRAKQLDERENKL